MKPLTFKSLMIGVAVALVAGFSSCGESEPKSLATLPQGEVKTTENDVYGNNDKVTFPMDEFENTFGWYIGFMDPGDVYSVQYDAKSGLCTLEDIGKNSTPPRR